MTIQVITSFLVGATAYALVETNISPSQAGFILSFAISASRGQCYVFATLVYLTTYNQDCSDCWRGTASSSRRSLAPSGSIGVSQFLSESDLLRPIRPSSQPDIQKPAQEKVDGVIPEKEWPSEGAIHVKNLCVRYAPDLPEVLHGITFSIEVGRAFLMSL